MRAQTSRKLIVASLSLALVFCNAPNNPQGADASENAPAAAPVVTASGETESSACPMTASKKGSWKYKNAKGKKVKVSYRFEDGGYPATITRIGNEVYYFKNSAGVLGRSGKRLRIVKVEGRRYAIDASGVLAKGWQYQGSSLYCFRGAYRAALVDGVENGIELSASGKANLNLNASLKLKCMKLLDRITTRSASKAKKLRAAWNWSTSRKRFRYVNYDIDTSSRSWAKRYANEMIDTHLGECQGFAALFCALAEEIGYKPYLVSGRVPGSRDHAADGYTGHACVMIAGKWYDPEAQFAGWATGVYGRTHYPMGFKSKKLHRFSAYAGTGAALGITKGFNGKVARSIGARSGKYYCYSKGKRLTGLRCLDGKLYKFDHKGYMKKSLFKEIQSAAREGQPWAKLRALIGKPRKSQSANSCYGEGIDHVYTYPHVRITTFEPSDGDAEAVVSHVAL